jgi:SAM-dependent methyltransferase
MIVKLRSLLHSPPPEPPVVWPSLQDELKDYLHYFTGKVLNAGAGNRDLARWIPGELVNQDIAEGLHNGNIDIYSPLHRIPRPDGYFDAVICNAVLEHVRNPEEVVQEFHRVLKRGGYLYLCIPFMQPEHLDPTDFQRYTKDGLRTLVEKHGFAVERIKGVHNVYHTLAWIVHEWLSSSSCWRYRLLRRILYPWLRYQTKHSAVYVDSIASAYRVLARKTFDPR